MADTKADTKAFINKIAPLVQTERKKRKNWVLPSVCIAQAALETGWGTSYLMTKANAFFGIKAGKSWKGKVFNTRTKECYDGRNLVSVVGCFRAYDNLADSVADYYDLICGNSRYAGAVNNADYKAAVTAIKNGGYATDPNYITNVCAIIKKYNLTQYDAVGGGTSAGAVGELDYEKVAREVIAGAWGVGTGRKQMLTAAGYDYDKVQALVNKMLGAGEVVKYTAQKGDTLSGIAKSYGTTVARLKEANSIKDVNKIYVGQEIVIK